MAGRKVINEHDARRCLAAVKSSRVDLGTWAPVMPHMTDCCLLKSTYLNFVVSSGDSVIHPTCGTFTTLPQRYAQGLRGEALSEPA